MLTSDEFDVIRNKKQQWTSTQTQRDWRAELSDCDQKVPLYTPAEQCWNRKWRQYHGTWCKPINIKYSICL